MNLSLFTYDKELADKARKFQQRYERIEDAVCNHCGPRFLVTQGGYKPRCTICTAMESSIGLPQPKGKQP